MFYSEAIRMDDTINVTIPVDAEAARALESPARRRAVGRYLSELIMGGRARDVLVEAIAEAKHEAPASGLTDEDIDAELEAWRAERQADRRVSRLNLRLCCPENEQPP
jgi:hypothetical protein